MYLVFYFISVVLVLGNVQGQQCPNNVNSLSFNSDELYPAPLSAPMICLGCCFRSGFPQCPTNAVWTLNGNDLTNGDINGSVIIDSSAILKLPDPDNVLSVGDILGCSAPSRGQHNITIIEFIFRNPTLSHNGIVDIKEGTTLTLSCDNPGNTDLGTTFYQWFNSTGGSLTNKVSSTPLNLLFTNIQRQSSGLYICQSTKDIVPDITMSNVTINVQYPVVITSITPASSALPVGNMIIINCTFDGNPAPENVTWKQNGTVLDPDNFTHISVDIQSTYSELTLVPQGLEDSGSYVCVTENILRIDNSSVVNITVQVAPSPVTSLDAQLSGTNSVKLIWSYGFNGNVDIIGVNITYEAISNSNSTHSVREGPVPGTETTILDLEPFTTYNFTVVVINTVSHIVGTSIPVSVTIETTPLVPNAPTLNSVTSINSTALRVSWTDNRDPFTQTEVQSFTVTYVPVDQSQLMLSVIVLYPNTTVDIGDLMKGTYYNVTIYANNSAGRSPDSNSVITRTDIDPPLSINMLTITSYPDSLCVSWQPPLENGGQNISSYQVYVRNDDATPTEDYILHRNLGPSNLIYIIEPLMNSNRYSVSVAVSNIEGGQSPNTTISKTTDAPLIPSVSNIIAFQATVRWTPSSENLDQRLQYRLQGQDWSNTREKNFSSSVSQYMYTNLMPETVYEIRLIRIGNDNCPQLISPTVNFTTLILKVVVNSTVNGPVTAGNGVVLVCNFDTGGAPSNVTWRRSDGVPIPPDVIFGNVLNITNPQVEDTANYTCLFQDVSYTFSLIVNPVPTSSTGLPVYAIPAIAGGVAVIIIIFIIVLIIVCCCVCCGKKDNKKYNVKKPKKTAGGMWLDEGASGYMPSTMSTNPTYRHTSADTVEEQRGRSLTTEQVTATSFNTLDKNDDRSGSQDKLTDDKYADIDFGTKSSRPYDEQRVEYATVGHTSFTSPQKNAIQTDV